MLKALGPIRPSVWEGSLSVGIHARQTVAAHILAHYEGFPGILGGMGRFAGIALLLLATQVFAGTPGIFRGVMYPGRDTKPGWVYIVGRNDTLRLVHIADATVSYAEEFPRERRRDIPAKDLKPGAEVRVTAEQDANGDWRATEIEIIRTAAKTSKPRSPSRSQWFGAAVQ